MPLLKPIRAIQLNRTHPLSRGLAGCWLFNEGSGGKVFDLSGNGNTGIFYGDTHFVPGKFGSCLSFDGTGDYVAFANIYSIPITISCWFNSGDDTANQHTIVGGNATGDIQIYRYAANIAIDLLGYSDSVVLKATSINTWYHIVGVWNSESLRSLYINGILIGSTTTTHTSNAAVAEIGKRLANTKNWIGLIDNVMIFNRALSAGEIAWLYREPFCIFEQVTSSAVFFAPIIDLSGSSTAQSTTAAIAKLVRRFKGASAAASETSAILKIIGEILLAGSTVASSVPSGKLTLSYRGPWLQNLLKIERQWLTDALFNGTTANAFKLGTILSGGWFWMRRTGCSALYRGPSMEQIDFANILSVIEQDAEAMSLPSYVPHINSSTYFYVVRRFNKCGYQERTLQAAVKLAIDADGKLTEPQPNNIFAWIADQVNGNKVQIVWFYCPLQQQSEPVRFKVYYDGGTGQIDYENPIASINYQGRKFYSFRSDALSTGRYLFSVRAEDASNVQNNSTSQLTIQIDGTDTNAIEILSVKEI